MYVIRDHEFSEFASFVKVNYGLDLTSKRAFVEMRLNRLIAENGCASFAEYFAMVCSDITGHAVTNLINNMTVNYTLFYRESYHFEHLATTVLPELYEKEQAGKDFRIWSAGCSTGEEPYTLAIILSDFLGPMKPQWNMQILATDISTYALKKAIIGAYPSASIEGLNPDWRKRYFVPDPTDKDNVLTAPAIKNEVIFRKHNMVKDPFAFKRKFHVIFCRNVMIYFDEATKMNVVDRFASNLAEGGYLFIGMSETLNHNAAGLQYVIPSVYRKGKVNV